MSEGPFDTSHYRRSFDILLSGPGLTLTETLRRAGAFGVGAMRARHDRLRRRVAVARSHRRPARVRRVELDAQVVVHGDEYCELGRVTVPLAYLP